MVAPTGHIYAVRERADHLYSIVPQIREFCKPFHENFHNKYQAGVYVIYVQYADENSLRILQEWLFYFLSVCGII